MPVQIVQILTEPDLLPKLQYLFNEEHGPVPFEVSYIYMYIYITQVILTFWLVLTYDLLEDRHKVFPPCFKMAESFENLDKILHDWAKDKRQKSLAKALDRFEKQEEER